MNKYEKYKFLKEELKAPRFENEDEEVEWFAVQLYDLYNQALRLRQENRQLKEENEYFITKLAEYAVKIDKAIEYLEEHYTDFPDGMDEDYDVETIKILKGE